VHFFGDKTFDINWFELPMLLFNIYYSILHLQVSEFVSTDGLNIQKIERVFQIQW
jgi:hypothetical protein